MSIRAVLFDFDGTLADTLPIAFYAFRAVFQQYEGKVMSDDEIVSTFGPTEEEIIQRNLSNPEMVDSAIEYYYEVFEQQIHTSANMPIEIINMIQELQQQQVKMAIITNKSRRCLDICMDHLGITDLFEVSISGEEVSVPKPDPEGIMKAMQLMNMEAHEAIFVGDSQADILAGKSANIMTVGVNWFDTVQTSHFTVEPDYRFTRTEELVSYIQYSK